MHPRVIQGCLGYASIAVALRVHRHLFPGLDVAAAADLDKLRTTAAASDAVCGRSGVDSDDDLLEFRRRLLGVLAEVRPVDERFDRSLNL
jgi:hypothetical protein